MHPLNKPDLQLHRDNGYTIQVFDLGDHGCRWAVVTLELIDGKTAKYQEHASGIIEMQKGVIEEAITRADGFIDVLTGEHLRKLSEMKARQYPMIEIKKLRRQKPHTRSEMERLRNKFWNAEGKLFGGEGEDRK